MVMHSDAVRDYLLGLQGRIVAALEAEGGDVFGVDRWSREPGGSLEGDGVSRLVEGGRLLERGGCGFSHVRGKALPASATQHRGQLAGAPFEAMGVSVVLHPLNPFVPTVHMNVRMLAATPAGPDQQPVVWFGGGMDLTPYYGFEEDACHFHGTLRDMLAPFGAERYPLYKRWCDDYFFLKHRNEPRGIGGIFFDDVAEPSAEAAFAMLRAVGETCDGANCNSTCTGGVTNLANSPSTSGISMMSIWSSASTSLKKNDGVSAHTNSHTPSRQRYMRNWGDAPTPDLLAPNGRKMPGNSMRIDVFIALTACSPDTVHAWTVPRVARSTRGR